MILETIYKAILNGDVAKIETQAATALEAHISAKDILYKACIPAMEKVGQLFEQGEKFVPEMLISAQAMRVVLTQLDPILVRAGVKTRGRVVIGTVSGDLHDIGKNLVAMMLRGTGFEVIDLGVGVPPQTFVTAVREKEPQIVGMSALLTSTMPAMKSTIKALVEAGLRQQVKVLVGGAPITRDFADQIGADGFASDAAAAARQAKELITVNT